VSGRYQVVIPGDAPTWAQRLQATFNSVFQRINLDIDVISEGGPTSETGPTQRRRLAERFGDRITVKDFGAVADYNVATGAGTDNTEAFQAALTWASTYGKTVHIPPGKYKIDSGLTLNHDETVINDEYSANVSTGLRGALVGAGSQTTVLYIGSGNFTALYGEVGNSGLTRIEGFKLYKIGGYGTTANKGLQLENYSYTTVRDVWCQGFYYGIYLRDCFSMNFERVVCRANNYGLESATPVEAGFVASVFDTCDFGQNTELGVLIRAASNITFLNCSIQGNGVGGVDTYTGGALFYECVGAAVTFVGGHFEANMGDADINIVSTGEACTYVLSGTHFIRLDNVTYVTNHIFVDHLTYKVTLILDGCDFYPTGTYVADAARKAIRFNAIGQPHLVLDSAQYGSALEKPAYTTSIIDVPSALAGVGTATNDSAAAGYIGEIITSSVVSGSAVALTTGVVANVTSISLTAGDWDVSGKVRCLSAATTTNTYFAGGISTTSATLPADESDARFDFSGVTLTTPNIGLTAGPTRISIAATTTVYLVTFAIFAVDTLSAYGTIRARRVR
jgi:hypothetical protein